jgi:hypothetical protein
MMNDELAKPESAEPTAAPGINIKMLAKGTTLLLEGDNDLYELVVQYPEYGIVEVTSTNPALRQPTVGQFMHSAHGSHPGLKLNVIQQGWAMILRFSNGQLQTQPIASARVRGTRPDGSHWSYDVF